MEEKTKNALRWIVEILNKNNIAYRIGGGFAAHVYGSPRPIKDIDITFSGKYFSMIMSDVSGYIEYDLGHYSNEKWDCDYLLLDYHGQKIDITDIDTLKMSNKEQTKWFQTKDEYKKFPIQNFNIEGVSVSLIDPRDLIAYKKELADDEHLYQEIDIKAVEEYLKNKNELLS